MRVLVLQGPNVNRLGQRGPHYGSITLEQVTDRLEGLAERSGCTLTHVRSNSQGTLIDAVQQEDEVDAILINPGGLTNTGVGLRDAIEDLGVLTAVVHVTNCYRRERWRRQDVFADIADIYIMGAGAFGYVIALEALQAPGDWLARRSDANDRPARLTGLQRSAAPS